eukprot:jgi/Bigna1/67815/fgenesh1_pg.4_\
MSLSLFGNTLWFALGSPWEIIHASDNLLKNVARKEKKKKSFEAKREVSPNSETVFIMVSGDRSQVGKSSVCLGLLGSLLETGIATPQQIAYIKPATQCEKPTLISKFCRSRNIQSMPIGPVVYFSGFTRSFLNGKQPSSNVLLDKIFAAVKKISQGKKYVIVDGVGYPAVGSITGTSNAQIAAKLNVPVVLVGGKGVGNAVDSTNLNTAYFNSFGVSVLGSIFNKLPEEGYYSRVKCKEAVESYYNQFKPNHRIYGFIPEIKAQIISVPTATAIVMMAELVGANKKPSAPSSEERAPGKQTNKQLKASDDVRMTKSEAAVAEILIKLFMKFVDVESIVQDAKPTVFSDDNDEGKDASPLTSEKALVKDQQDEGKQDIVSRDEIEEIARCEGGSGG